MSYGGSNDQHEAYQYSYMTSQYGNMYLSDGNSMTNNDETTNYWANSPRTDSPSPNGQGALFVGPHQIYTPSYAENDHRGTTEYTEYEYTETRNGIHVPYVRIVKRRTTANKKERRRTLSINNAYQDLRSCIPNVPHDTKMSKIKTLRLATSYISYLTRALETNDPALGFKAELGSSSRKSSSNNQTHVDECSSEHISTKSDNSEDPSSCRRVKGRTGWPQHVWALELKQDQTL